MEGVMFITVLEDSQIVKNNIKPHLNSYKNVREM